MTVPLYAINCPGCGFTCYRNARAEKTRKCPECRSPNLISTLVPDGNPVLVREANGVVSQWLNGAWVSQ